MSDATNQPDSRTLYGIRASEGVAVGTAFVFAEEDSDTTETAGAVGGQQEEALRARDAFGRAAEQLSTLAEEAKERLGSELAHILRSQQTLAEDESILGEVLEKISGVGLSAADATSAVFGEYHALFEELPDDSVNSQRVADLDDVGDRIIRVLTGASGRSFSGLPPNSIVVAENLSPSETVTMPTERVLGIVTEHGNAGSHVAILARGLGIPAVVGAATAVQSVSDGEAIAIDCTEGRQGVVIVRPDEEQRAKITRRGEQLRARRAEVEKLKGMAAETLDGRAMTLSANIAEPGDASRALEQGAASVGLMRTEFLFMRGATLPDEETQERAYRSVAEAFEPGMVIVRTLDAGGDKELPSLGLSREENPFLGFRAIRIGLARPELLKTQLRAILRAATAGDLKIMFPMISSLEEVRRLKALVEDARVSLREDGLPVVDHIDLGVMIEIPSAVLMIREIAREVQFVSIGTNDLTQYLLAADRTNETVADYYAELHPAVFRSIERIVDGAHEEGIWVGVCGELAANPLAVPVLTGLGVDELSMAASSVLETLRLIRESHYSDTKELAKAVVQSATQAEVLELVEKFAGRNRE